MQLLALQHEKNQHWDSKLQLSRCVEKQTDDIHQIITVLHQAAIVLQ